MYKNSTQLLPSLARLWKQGEHVALLGEGVAFTDASFNDGNGSGSGGVGGDRTLEKKEPSAVLHGPRHCLGFAKASFTVPLQSSIIVFSRMHSSCPLPHQKMQRREAFFTVSAGASEVRMTRTRSPAGPLLLST